MDSESRWVRALDGSEFMPGLVGLNNMRANDYVNVCVQVCLSACVGAPVPVSKWAWC